MHLGCLGGTWGVPPDTPGHAKECRGGFLTNFRSFWGPFLEALGALWDPRSALQAIKYGKADVKMELFCQPCTEVDIGWRSERPRVVPELHFRLKVQ